MIKRLLVFSLLLHSSYSFADKYLVCDEFSNVNTGVTEFNLEDLMAVPLFLSASQQGECTRSTASIVSTITGTELLNMGARDLIDAMVLIPGFNFGGIMTNMVGLGIRGIQTDEGKLSVMIDGVIVTEQRFGITGFGSHFPVDHIDRIEVIRGPGSILYGNFAELGVINIITKKGHQLNGGVIGGSYGRFERGEASKNTFLTMGKKWGDLEISFYGKYNDSQRSDRFYVDAKQNSFDMTDNNQLKSLLGNVQVQYKALKLHFLVDEYTVDSADGFADEMSLPKKNIQNTFTTYAFNLAYQFQHNDAVKTDVSFNFSQQTPWKRTNNYRDGRGSQVKEEVAVNHYTFDLKSTYSADAGHYLTLGNSFQFQSFQHKVSNFNGDLPLFGDYTLYTEGVYKTKWANILLGLRFDWYTQYGTNFSPRVGFTKQFNQFHYKVLYNQAFHVPTGGNYQLNEEYNQTNHLSLGIEQIVPEKTYNYELELGYRLRRNLDVTINLFYTEIQQYFLYSFDENFDDFYRNAGTLSTWGTEAVLSYHNAFWGKLKVNYGFYQAVKDTTNDFKIINDQGRLLNKGSNIGYPSHKVTANHTFSVTHSLSFNHTVLFFSERYGYSGGDLIRYKPTWIYNTYLRYQDALLDGLEVGLGLYDVFNGQYQYVQTFNGGHPALPGNTREVRLKVSYKF